jgi:hypothetical protein
VGSRLRRRRDQPADELSDRRQKGEELEPPVRAKVSAAGPRSLYFRSHSRTVECRRPVSWDQPNALNCCVTW